MRREGEGSWRKREGQYLYLRSMLVVLDPRLGIHMSSSSALALFYLYLCGYLLVFLENK